MVCHRLQVFLTLISITQLFVNSNSLRVVNMVPPVGTTGNGTCGPTNYGGNCNTDAKGAWNAKANNINTIEDCVEKAKNCAMGRFVSFSVGWNDCSWYSDCDFSHLCADCTQPGPNCPGGNGISGHCPVYHPYESEVVRIGPAPPTPPQVVSVTVDWTSVEIITSTAATVEVDVMPFLGEADWGGPYEKYHTALSNLGSDYVRFAPWFANPRVVVPELTPHICTATHPATNWNSTYFDQVMKDFMSAAGNESQSVVQQLSTMPAWMYVGSYDKTLPHTHGTPQIPSMYMVLVVHWWTPLVSKWLATSDDLLDGTLLAGSKMNVDTGIRVVCITHGGGYRC